MGRPPCRSKGSKSSWASSSGHFAFRFYSQGNGFADGIWLISGSPPEKTIVWNANRDNPPLPSSSKLNLTGTGLRLFTNGNESQDLIPNLTAVTCASMLDSGNIVLYSNDTETVVWQSFDHPTDTMLGVQNLTNSDTLVSSVSRFDHSSGRFFFIMQADANLVAYPMHHQISPQDAYWASKTAGSSFQQLSLDIVLWSTSLEKCQNQGFLWLQQLLLQLNWRCRVSVFLNDITTIARTHHRNLVKLIGFCINGSGKLPVYEYISNGSLASFLFNDEKHISRRDTLKIALDIARGVLYLHEECEVRIIHCNINPRNILMDGAWTAKISDFGLARLLKSDHSRMRKEDDGTSKYLTPEWQKDAPVSVKLDIYSFGMVLLEIVCRRSSIDCFLIGGDTSFQLGISLLCSRTVKQAC
ncbi:hypothetical protein JHK82_047229 [Glycine max]|nr:hypothetical protein JHK86_047124 [Glycine max]KAG4943051.1 hypothetical protein JHK85_047697 [Glycine max]KAG5097375.1 hypothetical protein JHK82_047229 [Glycine max]